MIYGEHRKYSRISFLNVATGWVLPTGNNQQRRSKGTISDGKSFFFPRGQWRGAVWASPNSVSLYWAAVMLRLGISLQSCWRKWVMIRTSIGFLFINWSLDCWFTADGLSTGIKSCAVTSFHIRDPTGCRLANAHPLYLFSWWDQ